MEEECSRRWLTKPENGKSTGPFQGRMESVFDQYEARERWGYVSLEFIPRPNSFYRHDDLCLRFFVHLGAHLFFVFSYLKSKRRTFWANLGFLGQLGGVSKESVGSLGLGLCKARSNTFSRWRRADLMPSGGWGDVRCRWDGGRREVTLSAMLIISAARNFPRQIRLSSSSDSEIPQFWELTRQATHLY